MPVELDRTNATIRRVLVPLDGSTAALDALAFARQFPDAMLLLLQVAIDSSAGFPDDEMGSIQKNLDVIAETLREDGRAVDTMVTTGDPAEEIVATAQQQGATLIVMTTHGRGAAGRMLFGSVADRVSRSTTVPTILVRIGQHPERTATTRIVVALDGSPRSASALPVAESIATSLGLPITLVRSVTLEDTLKTASLTQDGQPGQPLDTTNETFALAREETERQAKEYLDHLAASLTGNITTLVLHGSPAATLLQAIQPSDLAIVTSHGTIGIGRWLLGSVAEKLVREASAPIVLVPTRS